jgi:hypothetical protein
LHATSFTPVSFSTPAFSLTLLLFSLVLCIKN